jgi:DNA-binding MarR family transcriptional regulator
VSTEPLSPGAQRALELISQAVEANPDADLRTIAQHSGVNRLIRDAALERLVREGFLERRRTNADWHYRSVKPYRAGDEVRRGPASFRGVGLEPATCTCA